MLGRKVGRTKATEQKREEYRDIISYMKRGYSVRIQPDSLVRGSL